MSQIRACKSLGSVQQIVLLFFKRASRMQHYLHVCQEIRMYAWMDENSVAPEYTISE